MRDKDNSVLGIVTDRYKVVQNSEAFAFTDELLGEGVRYETAGSLQGGRRTWLLARLPHQYIINMFLHSKISLKEVSDTVYDVIMEHMNYVPDVKITDLMNWNQMKSKICVKLINAEQNRELLTDMPHRFYLDFAVVYYIKISERGDKLETMDVKNKYLDMWGISEEELYRTGMENMKISDQVFFKNMKEVLPIWLQKEDEPSFPMYVLTNASRYYGASVLLLKKELSNISQSLGNILVKNRSVHFVI